MCPVHVAADSLSDVQMFTGEFLVETPTGRDAARFADLLQHLVTVYDALIDQQVASFPDDDPATLAKFREARRIFKDSMARARSAAGVG